LWVDIYDFIDCELVSPGDPLWVVISIGTYKTKNKVELKWKGKEKEGYWRYKPIYVEDDKLKDMSLPCDPSQIPDIFIDIYTHKTFGGDTRIGYLRMPVENCIQTKPRPNWFRFRSPVNDTGTKNVGSMMMAIQFLKYDVANPI